MLVAVILGEIELSLHFFPLDFVAEQYLPYFKKHYSCNIKSYFYERTDLYKALKTCLLHGMICTFFHLPSNKSNDYIRLAVDNKDWLVLVLNTKNTKKYGNIGTYFRWKRVHSKAEAINHRNIFLIERVFAEVGQVCY